MVDQKPNEKYKVADVIKAMANTRGIKSVVARNLGCDRDTIDNYINRHPTVRAAWEQEREQIIDSAESQLVLKVNAGEWPAIRHVLITLGRNRGYGESSETRLTGADGGPIRMEVDPKDALQARIAAIAARTPEDSDSQQPE
jgi:hypothetical protein